MDKKFHDNVWHSAVGMIAEDERESGGWGKAARYSMIQAALPVATFVTVAGGMNAYHAAHVPPETETPAALQAFAQAKNDMSLCAAAVVGAAAFCVLYRKLTQYRFA